MAWAATGVVWTAAGGIFQSRALGSPARADAEARFSFVQISDTHIGFNAPANPDVDGTLKQAVDRINLLPDTPDFLIHTGDLTHAARPAQFDSLHQSLSGLKQKQWFFVPGEHDIFGRNKEYLERYGTGTNGNGWYSFDHRGIHFVGLVNAGAVDAIGTLGADQLQWLADDLKGRSSSTPVVVFAHLPLWALYPEWGWTTTDSEEALSNLKRFGSVMVLNGHIHQVMRKVEGNIQFHTAASTAFPQPAPGQARSAGPMRVPADRLADVLGITEVEFHRGSHALAVTDESLGGTRDEKNGA
jgi:3',5'-cyclic AMP phosphodiesterase CpdA